jgi:hypothetical protein
VLTGELLVPVGATVGTAVIFNGDATIDGTATESVVAFNGDVEITGTVRDDVVAFNGRVIVRSGAEVGGDIASRQDPQIEDGATVGGEIKGISGRFDLEGLGWVARYVWWFGYTVSTLILGSYCCCSSPASTVRSPTRSAGGRAPRSGSARRSSSSCRSPRCCCSSWWSRSRWACSCCSRSPCCTRSATSRARTCSEGGW